MDTNTAVHDLHTRFAERFARPALKALATLVAHNHIHSRENGEQNYGEVGGFRCGFLRWMKTEADVLRLMGEGYEGIRAQFVSNSNGGGKHVEIVGGDFKLLIVHDADPDAVVPFSEYGKAEALNNRPSLFVSEEEWIAMHPAESVYTAVLFHSRGEHGQVPSCLEVRFPDGSDGYHAPALNLYAMFPELLDKHEVDRLHSALFGRSVVAEEFVQDQAHPMLRKTGQVGA